MDVMVRSDGTELCGPSAGGLVARLRARTRGLHRDAERSGILRDLLRGQVTLAGYALLLRNLHPTYAAMEVALHAHAHAPEVRHIAAWDLRRRAALEADLTVLVGTGWETRLPLLPAAVAYADRVATAEARVAGGLVAHAYVRYLGDLSGGQVLKRLLAKAPGIAPEALAFYDFGPDGVVRTLVPAYLAAIDAAGVVSEPRTEEIVEEAAAAFLCNIALSEALHGATNNATRSIA